VTALITSSYHCPSSAIREHLSVHSPVTRWITSPMLMWEGSAINGLTSRTGPFSSLVLPTVISKFHVCDPGTDSHVRAGTSHALAQFSEAKFGTFKHWQQSRGLPQQGVLQLWVPDVVDCQRIFGYTWTPATDISDATLFGTSWPASGRRSHARIAGHKRT
jgi:hypothetical protein